MDEKIYIRQKLRDRLENDDNSFRDMIMLCSTSTIRWIQRYSHCYSCICSFCCIPLWFILLPIAFIIDLLILGVIILVFLISFLIHFLSAPFVLLYKYSSCLAACDPLNMYLYSLREALKTTFLASYTLNMFWMCYCGTGEIEQGTPLCCSYICNQCHQSCGHATGIKIRQQPCTIL